MVRPLEYDTQLSFEEVKERYAEVEEAFGRVQRRYAGLKEQSGRRIKPKDNKTLADCIGVLLPLIHSDSVQREVRQAPHPKALYYQIGQLQTQIMLYLARFENSGVTVVNGAGLF